MLLTVYALVMGKDALQVLLWNPILELTCLLPIGAAKYFVHLRNGLAATPANFSNHDWVLHREGNISLS